MDRSGSRNELRSFLIGTLLGDCHVSPTHQWQWRNTTKDWVEWKAAYIRANLGFSCNVHESKDLSCKSGFIYGFDACSSKGRLKVYSDWFYDKNRIKRITKKIKHFNHPIGLMVLLIDQGSCRGGLTKDHKTGNTYYRKPTARIHLNKHSLEELTLFQKALISNFGLETTLQQKNSKYLDVYFNTRSSQLLWKLIGPYVPNIQTAKRKFDPFIFQTTNANYVQHKSNVDLV
jgi:hypothetical protein